MARQGDNYYLVITDTVTEDSGIYMTTAQNNDGEAKSYGRLAVNQQQTVSSSNAGDEEEERSTARSISVENRSGQPPEFKKLFYDKHVKLGECVRLDAVVVGAPKPKVNF